MSVRMLSRPLSSSGPNPSPSLSLASSASAGVPASIPLSPPSTASSPPSSPPHLSFPLPASPHSAPTRSSPSNPPPSTSNPPSISLPSSSFSHAFAAAGRSGPGSSVAGSLGAPLPGSNGVVVIGVISRSEEDASQLLDRLLDAQVFGGGGRSLLRKKDGQGSSGLQPSPGTSAREFEEKGNGSPNSQVGLPNSSNPDGSSHIQEDGVVSSEAAKRTHSQILEEASTHRNGEIELDSVEGAMENDRSTSAQRSMHTPQINSRLEGEEELREGGSSLGLNEWISGKLKHYYDEERGVLYVQFVWGAWPLDFLKEERVESLAERLERCEASSLCGLLFMFSVCHIILILQEGARFDPRYLRMFRTLQAAKHTQGPFVKTQVLPGLLPAPTSRPTPPPLRPVSLASSNASGRNAGVTGRQASTIALMSGSAPVLFPGQCTPVALFVCLDDFPEPPTVGTPVPVSNGSRSDDASETTGASFSMQTGSAPSLSPGNAYILRQGLQSKSSGLMSGPVRPGNKIETGFRKKIQSSTEAQIRFLLKKCRTVASVAGEGGSIGSAVGAGMGPRGPGSGVGSLPGGGGGGALFALDPSRAVVLLDRSGNRHGEALHAATDMLAEMLRRKEGAAHAVWDLTEGNGVAGEDLQAIRDFLWRHTEILRGRGGISNSSAGGSAGVGMVAAAAAAAAASAAAGASGGASGTAKPLHNPPELPTISGWLSACQILVDGLSSAWEGRGKGEGEVEKGELDKGKKGVLVKGLEGPRTALKKSSTSSPEKGSRNSAMTVSTLSTVRNRGSSLEGAISSLDSGVNLDLKFSMAWCMRVLPSAREVYLRGLPPCYPTTLHRAHLERALRAFRAMVRGPAVSLYAEKLKAECEAVWHAGKQLCDAESLTGKPCIHQVHEVIDLTVAKTEAGTMKLQERSTKGKNRRLSKPHSSGVVFLHACACGRSRRLRNDPFDYESANVTFFQFPNCENLLPSLAMRSSDSDSSHGGSSWSLVRLGNAGYYQPSVGLMQTGFCAKQNFLSPWDILVVFQKDSTADSSLKEDVVDVLPLNTSNAVTESEQLTSKPKLLLPRPQTGLVDPKSAGHMQHKLYSKVTEKGSLTEVRLPSVRSTLEGSDSHRAMTTFTSKANYGGDSAFPPLPQKHERLTPAKAKQTSGKERKDLIASQPFQRDRHPGSKEHPVVMTAEKNSDGREAGEEEKAEIWSAGADTVSVKAGANVSVSRTGHFRVYIGFEFECPHGHRFFLSLDHLQGLGPHYAEQISDFFHSTTKQESENGAVLKQTRQDRRASVMKEHQKPMKSPIGVLGGGLEGAGKSSGASFLSNMQVERKAREGLEFMRVSECSGEGHTLLGLNLPIYLNCPHCKDSDSSDKKANGVVFAGSVAQLQRIFLVTPSVPLVFASRAVVQFEGVAGLKISNQGKCSVEFNNGSEVVLPPDSFLSLRLPFVYYTRGQDGDCKPLLCQRDNPERTAWLVKGTAVYVLSKDGEARGPLG